AFYSFGTRIYIIMAVLMVLLRALMVARFVAELPEKRKIGSHIFSFGLVVLTFYLYDLLKLTAQTEPLRTNEFLLRKLLLYGGIRPAAVCLQAKSESCIPVRRQFCIHYPHRHPLAPAAAGDVRRY